ncbi:MAG TPA: SpoIID/LytB domain-containing protein [Nocardioidaceae bacterium]|nr:SpoIID/LytB domain-containing protein [Nocardioidaceae bacterium]
MAARRRGAAVAVLATAMALGSLGGDLRNQRAEAASTDQSYWVPVSKKIVVNGHGYGHGHGMSQHGAQGAALKGLSYKEIGEFYYPGTTWGKVKGKVRVLISADTSDDVVVSSTAGLGVRNLAERTTHVLPVRDGVSRWRLVVRQGRTVVQFYNGSWRRFRAPWVKQITGDAEFFANGPIRLWTPSGSRTYRGFLRAAAPSRGSSARDTVNVVSMDQYVMGVVPYEMPASWHPEAVKAQAVAARTYATWSRNQNMRRHYQICDTTACQVYGGTGSEDPRSNVAVRATQRLILTHGGKPAFTQFSASSGGWTSAGSMPYLPAKEDPYDDWQGNTVHSWRTTVDVSRLERSHPSIGTLRRIWVTNRDGNGEWQGRVTSLVLDGTKGNVTISGDSFRWAFALRSSWFSIEPTPIINRWSRIGGADSPLGAVRSGEYAVAAGAAQQFQRGRIFHSSRTGAKELYGPILHTYKRMGGPSSKLGFPKTPVRKIGANSLARFQDGTIFKRGSYAPVVVSGAIDRRYHAEGGRKSGLGWPTTSNYRITGGQRVDYVHGYIVWKRKTNTTRVVRN